MIGVVYLIRLDRKLHHSQYYIGWCKGDPRERLNVHRSGHGSKFLAACNREGIDYHIVRTWKGVDRHFERKLKNRKNSKHFCPIANPDMSKYLAKVLIQY